MTEITLVTLLDGEKSFVVESYLSSKLAHERIDSLQEKLVDGTVLVTEMVSIMDKNLIVLTEEELIKAFTAWYSEFETKPLSFSETKDVSSADYAYLSSNTLLTYIKQIQKGE